MAKTTLVGLSIALAFTLASAGTCELAAAEFSAEVTALPFPPDARELEFVAWAEDINYKSQSPLKSLAAFYLKEMAARGWEHDESAAEIDEDSIELTFKHGGSKVELDLSQWSKEVHISLDCENLEFTGTDDPAKLAAAGIPVPRAARFLQKELPLPAGVVDLRYTGDGSTFKSSLTLPQAFAYFMRLVPGKGFRESRRPIITETRRYTEFRKGAAELSVNVFSDDVGSRIVLTYADNAKEPPVRPLPAVASLPIKGGGADKPATSETTAVPVDATPIDVTKNKGSATVSYAGKQYKFTNVACFRTKSRGSDATTVVFSGKPIPYQKMQTLIATNDDFSFGDLYEFSSPDHLTLQLGEHPSFSFGIPGVGLGHPVENSVNEMKLEAARVHGTLKMPPIEIFRGEKFSFTATADAAIITPGTRITGPGDPVVRSDSPILADSPVPFPEGIENVGREGSKFRKTYSGVVGMPLTEVASFYRQELAAKGWKRQDAESADDTMRFKNDKIELSVVLKQERGKTAIEVITRDIALARQEGILPEPGKGRLILGNANNVAVTFSIGTANYTLKPGQGAKDQKQALNYSVAPGAYTVVLKTPGQRPQTEKIKVAEGSAWGLIALPNGGSLPIQLY
ncbi:MAG: hypothetical protein WD894_05070 [Pirellulales bacterium]